MTKRASFLGILIALTAASGAWGSVSVTDRLQNEFPLASGGVVVIENPAGNIEVTGGSEGRIIIASARVIRAVDNASVAEARQRVNRIIEGNEKTRVIRTAGDVNGPRWHVQIHYTVVVPRSANLKIVSSQTNGIRVTGVHGLVAVKNVSGPVTIENVRGQVTVDNVNGDVFFLSQLAPANARLTSVNGSISVRAPAAAGFTWEAETFTGDAVTSFPLRSPRFLTPTRFRGTVNNQQSNVTIVTETFSGNIALMRHGTPETPPRSVRTLVPSAAPPQQRTSQVGAVGPMLPPNPNHPDLRLPLVQGFYRYETSIGDVRIDEIRGATRIVTGAGLVQLGSVFGHAEVVSLGGPLTLGEIHGPLQARTEAGNITIDRAREGGTVSTGGGTIQVQYSGGAMELTSGGGDIVLRQANGAVTAETRSGDINIAFQSGGSAGKVLAKTAKGNILLTLPAGMGADIDAVVLTSDPTMYSIRSDFAGLSVQREQVGGKTRIRATGRINGGGERLELSAQDGGIHIAADAPQVSPMIPR